MSIDDQKLMAYADGELEDGEHVNVERALAADPVLADKLARHRALATTLSGAMQRELAEPVPERLLRVARTASAGSAAVADIAGRTKPTAPGLVPRWTALAASFAFGAVGAALWLHMANDNLLDLQHGRLAARGELAIALTQQLADRASTGARTQVGITFRDNQGHYCRTFSIRDRAATAGLACHDAEGWSVETFAPLDVTEVKDSAFRMAASPMPKEILQAIDARIVGEALDADAERRAQAHGWRD